MRYAESILELVGGTPLLRLGAVWPSAHLPILAKLEFLNPGGSVKDRTAARMIEAAEESGALRPGGTIVAPTSGNTGAGLAAVAARRGYRCVFTCPDKVSHDRLQVLRALGARVVVCPAAVPPTDPRSYRSVATELTARTPGAVQLDQYSDPHNAEAHYRTTGPEIWAQTEGRITHFVASVGTGGTISGAGRYLKEVSGGRVQVIGADPDGSVYSGGPGRPHLLEGVGQPSFPLSYDAGVADLVLAIPDRDSLHTARRLAREEGLLVGASGGLVVAAAVRVAEKLAGPGVLVVLLPDSGRGYLRRTYDDEWMARMGMLVTDGDEPTVADLLAKDPPTPLLPELPVPSTRVEAALRAVAGSGRAALPVVAAPGRLRFGEVVGSVSVAGLRRAAAAGAAMRPLRDADCIEPPLPHIGTGQTVAAAVHDMGTAGPRCAAVLSDGSVVSVLDERRLRAFLRGGSPTRRQ